MAEKLKLHIFDPSRPKGTLCGAKLPDTWDRIVDPSEWWLTTCARCADNKEIREKFEAADRQIELLFEKISEPPLSLNKIIMINNLCIIFGLDKAFEETEDMIAEYNGYKKGSL
jgi:hypothetical protein